MFNLLSLFTSTATATGSAPTPESCNPPLYLFWDGRLDTGGVI